MRRSARPSASSAADATPVGPQEATGDDIAWRELTPGLWVGRAGDDHVGIIERGRSYTLTDAHDQVHRGFPTLAAAQTATGAIDVVGPALGEGSDTHDPTAARRRPLAAWAIAAVCLLSAAAGAVHLGTALLPLLLLP